jgi:hypothetical protein
VLQKAVGLEVSAVKNQVRIRASHPVHKHCNLNTFPQIHNGLFSQKAKTNVSAFTTALVMKYASKAKAKKKDIIHMLLYVCDCFAFVYCLKFSNISGHVCSKTGTSWRCSWKTMTTMGILPYQPLARSAAKL